MLLVYVCPEQIRTNMLGENHDDNLQCQKLLSVKPYYLSGP